MDTTLTRKQFFRTVACKTARFTVDLIEPMFGTEEARPIAETSLAADLSPELLKQEAIRLGLDPGEPEKVLDYLSSHLQRPGS